MKSVFKDRIISQRSNTELEWPAHSPDLNVLDYWFWSGLHKLITKHEPKTKSQLKSFCNISCVFIEKESVAKSIDDFEIRLNAVIHNNGGHFEEELPNLKRKWSNQPPAPCSQCKCVHRCLCSICEKQCLEDFQDSFEPLGVAGFNEIHEYLSGELDEVEQFAEEDDEELDYNYPNY